MKTKLIALIALIGLFSFSNTYAGEKEKMVKQTVQQEIQYPQFAIEQDLEGTVWVSFVIKDNGEIEVTQINSDCIPLKNYVLNKMENMDAFKLVTSTHEESYQMYFDFHLI